MGGGGGGGAFKGLVHNLLMQFFTLDSSKIEVFKTYVFDIVIAKKDHPKCAKHVLGRIYVFFTPFGYQVGGGGGGLPRDGCTTYLCSFSTRTAQESKFSKLVFFDIVTTQNDHPSYAKHVLGRIYVFFTLFGYQVGGGGGGGFQGTGAQPAYAVFQRGQLKNQSFRNFVFLIF